METDPKELEHQVDDMFDRLDAKYFEMMNAVIQQANSPEEPTVPKALEP